MDRSSGAEAIVKRIWVLQRIDTEELDRMLKDCHFSRLTSMNACGQWGCQESINATGPVPGVVVSRHLFDLHRT